MLVCTDILGLTKNPPKFVKQYADLDSVIVNAYSNFVDDVKNARFPEGK